MSNDTQTLITNLPEADLVNKLYNNISLIIGKKKMDTTNTILIVTDLIQMVEKYPKLKGAQKKSLIIYVLRRFVKDNLDDEEQKAILTFIDLFLPSVIDTIIAVDKKEIVVKMKKGIKKYCPCC